MDLQFSTANLVSCKQHRYMRHSFDDAVKIKNIWLHFGSVCVRESAIIKGM